MANLTNTPDWSDIVQLETSTIALGGAGGPMNEQAKSLGDRTEYLKERTNPSTPANTGIVKLSTITAAILGQESDTAVTPAGLKAAIIAVMNSSGGSITADPADDIPVSPPCPGVAFTSVYGSGGLDVPLLTLTSTSSNSIIQSWSYGSTNLIMVGEWGSAPGDYWVWSVGTPVPPSSFGMYEFNFPTSYTVTDIVSALNAALTPYSTFTAEAASGAGSMSISKLAVYGINPLSGGFTANTPYEITGVAGSYSSGVSATFDLAKSTILYVDAELISEISAPKNATGCQAGLIVIEQGAVPVNVSFSAFWVPAAGSAPALTMLPNAVDVVSFIVMPGGASAVYSVWGHLPDSVPTSYSWAGSQSGPFLPLTSAAASIAVNLGLSNNFSHTLTENTELAAPTNAVAGQSGVIHFTQHASAAKTLAFDAFWYFGATTPTISATLDAVCAVSYVIEPGATRALCSMGGDLA